MTIDLSCGVFGCTAHAKGLSATTMSAWRARRMASIVSRVAQHGEALATVDDRALMREARTVGALLKRHPDWPHDLVARSFAVTREVASRTLGQRHYDVQLIAGYAMVRGMIAEMATGEGKTLAATLAAATAGLGGVPVHVVTVNAYLAERDAVLMAQGTNTSSCPAVPMTGRFAGSVEHRSNRLVRHLTCQSAHQLDHIKERAEQQAREQTESPTRFKPRKGQP